LRNDRQSLKPRFEVISRRSFLVPSLMSVKKAQPDWFDLRVPDLIHREAIDGRA